MSLPAIDSPEAALAALEGAAMGMRDCNLPGSARTIDECRRVLAAALAVSRTLREALATLLSSINRMLGCDPRPVLTDRVNDARVAALAALRSGQTAKPPENKGETDDTSVRSGGISPADFEAIEESLAVAELRAPNLSEALVAAEARETLKAIRTIYFASTTDELGSSPASPGTGAETCPERYWLVPRLGMNIICSFPPGHPGPHSWERHGFGSPAQPASERSDRETT